jgi:protein-tyrosine phosphatase
MAAALLAIRLTGTDVESVGLLEPGHEASPGSVRAMAARGIDIRGHRSATLSVAAVERADLVLGMAKSHVREAVVLVPSAFGRSFTLPELVRLGEGVGPATDLPTWLADVGRGRRPVDLLGDGGADDVADPIGRPDVEYEQTAALLEDLVERLGKLIGNLVIAR